MLFLFLQQMATFVINAMEADGSKILHGYCPTAIKKDSSSGKLKVTLQSRERKTTEVYDTVLMAVGMLYVPDGLLIISSLFFFNSGELLSFITSKLLQIREL